MLLPMMHIFLNQGLIQPNDTLEQLNGLVAVVDLGGCELIHRGVVGLELTGLEEGNRVLHKRHRC